MVKGTFLIVALLAVCQSAFAAAQPTAGSQVQQIRPAPITQKDVPKIRIDRGPVPISPAGDQTKIMVKSLHVTGQSLYSEADLVRVSGFIPVSELTLSDLRGLAEKIAAYYHRHGYFVAQAYLPVQDIKDGAVTIAVSEGRYNKISLNNQAFLSDHLADSLLSDLHQGDVIASASLERDLLLLSELPAVTVKSTLVPSVAAGASDLIIDLKPGPRISGEVDADNAGNRYTGAYRLGATVNFNEPLGYGDVFSVRGLTTGSGLNYVRASYQFQLGAATVGAAYSFLDYRLGKEFDSLHANGTANIASIYGSYPLIRSRNSNLYAGFTFNNKDFEDRVDSVSSVVNRKANVVMASLYGDHRDTLIAGGLNSFSLTWSSGYLDIKSSAAHDLDAETAKSDGIYNKLGFSAMRLQNVTDSFSLYGSINGQYAFKNLDISEKMELGGMYAVRAYPEGEAFGDEGYVLTLEARQQLPRFIERLPGQVQLIGFVDTGTVKVNHNTWTSEDNSRTLSGAGVGLTWMEYNNFTLRAYYALKLGGEDATSAPDRSGRFWIQVVKYF
jgi:hemolysin activation/secretion protein